MSFNESDTVEAHLSDFLGPASVRPAQLSPGLARIGGRIAGVDRCSIAPAHVYLLGVQFRSGAYFGKQI